jgi:hypothetical protein
MRQKYNLDPRNKTAPISFEKNQFDLWAWKEVQIIWSRIQQDYKLEAISREWFGAATTLVGYNTHDKGRSAKQWGGTPIVVRDDLYNHVCKKGAGRVRSLGVDFSSRKINVISMHYLDVCTTCKIWPQIGGRSA